MFVGCGGAARRRPRRRPHVAAVFSPATARTRAVVSVDTRTLVTVIEGIVFDLDGVLIDSEQAWDRARRRVAAEQGGHWRDEATGAMQGMSSTEWSRYMRTTLDLPLPPQQISDLVVGRLLDDYRDGLPLLPGAVEAVLRAAATGRPLALASSSNREVIDRVLEITGLSDVFQVTLSSEEVPRGKPHPDVYLEAARRLGRRPRRLAAVEDSANGIRSALAAGLTVIAVPSRDYPPSADVLQRAAVVLDGIHDLDAEVIAGVEHTTDDHRLDEQEEESFPASDSHADWAGPPD